MSNASHYVYHCTDSPTAVLVISSWAVVKYSLFFPLSIFILYWAYQQWRPLCSFQTASHLDILTYHMVVIELIGAGGAFFLTSGIHTDVKPVVMLGVFLTIFCFPGQILIHCLTCMDRYLAVVHPITYLKLRQATGIKIRNLCILITWLSCIGSMIMQAFYALKFPTIPFIGLLLSASILVSFCNLSVLQILIRPGPSDNGRDRVDKLKRKAFNTITAILVTLCVSFVGFIVSLTFTMFNLTNYEDQCTIFTCGLWSNIPNSLILPILFLKRTGKVQFKLFKI